MAIQSIKIMGDSQLVIRQLRGEYQCIIENIIELYVRAEELLTNFPSSELIHITRYQNAEANELAQMASDYRITKELAQAIIIETKWLPPMSNRTMVVEARTRGDSTDWQTPLFKI